jgi:hypothetical protein
VRRGSGVRDGQRLQEGDDGMLDGDVEVHRERRSIGRDVVRDEPSMFEGRMRHVRPGGPVRTDRSVSQGNARL